MRDNEAFSKELEQAEKNLYTRRKFVGLAGTAALRARAARALRPT